MVRTPLLIVRAVRPAVLMACLFSGCTCAGNSAPNPMSTPTAGRLRATSVPPAAAKPTPAAQNTAPAAGNEVVPPARSEADATRRGVCERYVAVLSGRSQDRALLEDANVQMLAKQVPDLVACGAVSADSDALCQALGDHEFVKPCRDQQSIFHELRTNPNGRGFVFPDADYESCRSEQVMAAFCDDIRAAARAGDPNRCPAGRMQAFCRAMVSLDKSLCGGLEEQHECEVQVERKMTFGQGLTALAQSGPLRERALAQAALGQADACKSFAQSALRACLTATPVTEGSPAADSTPEATP